MPILQNYRYEAFAQSRARGQTLENAYEDAGFAPGYNNGRRLNLREDVAERVAEIRATFDRARHADVPEAIVALLRMAKASEALQTPAGTKEARLAVLDALRLHRESEAARNVERANHSFWAADEDEDEDD